MCWTYLYTPQGTSISTGAQFLFEASLTFSLADFSHFQQWFPPTYYTDIVDSAVIHLGFFSIVSFYAGIDHFLKLPDVTCSRPGGGDVQSSSNRIGSWCLAMDVSHRGPSKSCSMLTSLHLTPFPSSRREKLQENMPNAQGTACTFPDPSVQGLCLLEVQEHNSTISLP